MIYKGDFNKTTEKIHKNSKKNHKNIKLTGNENRVKIFCFDLLSNILWK